MKKAMSILLATILLLSLSLGVAAETQSSTITYSYQKSASYMISIPSSVELSEQGTAVNITASEIIGLEGKWITVYVAGTNAGTDAKDVLCVRGNQMGGKLFYQIIPAAGAKGKADVLTGGAWSTGLAKTINTNPNLWERRTFQEIASFKNNETKSFTIKPLNTIGNPSTGEYTGTITYGIELVNV